ncbi:MAG: dNTP triphosphohydrolase [Mogibacterium diversum]|uniref:dGTP triphosphohydrolase n=1 Tax=Mogibacterium diversum TaxID=114527 RepID=UPI00204E87B1|nr:dNTP triphosphohydrolase [Mogibacterium diversum]UQF80939.1 MAG: dNTP triphosphohydrolase [Mogibacterium diversum]
MSNSEIPFKSSDLEKLFNDNIGQYGYKGECKNNNEEETYRTSLRRQRDKILYTGGFRRLQDKTQVISATISGDHRTRLTHTLEVEQIAVSVANALSLNVDLVSAIAFGHDVGHTPFGHAAERVLNNLLKDSGGFNHSIESIKYIWGKYGNKIQKEIYEGILLHDSDMYQICKENAKKQLKYVEYVDDENKECKVKFTEFFDYIGNFPSTLEAQVVIWADKIAYITHDLEDFQRSEAYTDLKKNDETIEEKLNNILNNLIKDKEIKKGDYKSRDLIRNIIRELVESSAETIKAIDYKDIKEQTEYKRDKGKKETNSKTKKEYLDSLLINCTDDYRKHYYELRGFLDEYYIFSPQVQRSDGKAKIIIEWLFGQLTRNYKLAPLHIRDEIDKTIIMEIKEIVIKASGNNELKKLFEEEKELNIRDIDKIFEEYNSLADEYNLIKKEIIDRKIASYIATMSDTYAESMYRNLIGSKVDLII